MIFLCTKDYIMEDESKAFSEGVTYAFNMQSVEPDCVDTIDDEGTFHIMNLYADMWEYFKPVIGEDDLNET